MGILLDLGRIRSGEDANGPQAYLRTLLRYNPVKHGLAPCPHAWRWSSFGRFVARGHYPIDWRCSCNGGTITPPRDIEGAEMD